MGRHVSQPIRQIVQREIYVTLLSRYYVFTYKITMDPIFKALNDPTRRALLDALREKDGQSLTELEQHLALSRFGVMKHLKVLEEAQLVLPRKSGRFKFHYLNAMPLQEVTDRWIAPFLVPQAKAPSDPKPKSDRDCPTGKPDFMMQTSIRCTRDALWSALTEADKMAAYHFACTAVQGNPAVDETTTFILPNGQVMLRQVTTAMTPKSRLAMTFEPLFMGPNAPFSHMVYRIEPQGEGCQLTIEHFDIAPGQERFGEGWARLSVSLKSYLETGRPLRTVM
jgi:DNA-binding transcriptional ArsR family regulator/uncharacterized protein YndB with AHSA1/START domain